MRERSASGEWYIPKAVSPGQVNQFIINHSICQSIRSNPNINQMKDWNIPAAVPPGAVDQREGGRCQQLRQGPLHHWQGSQKLQKMLRKR